MQAQFGRYELVAPLDKGGMGEVWLARARGPARVQKTVVLKRIRAERAGDDAARARFADEARVAMSLSHPHIVPVFEFGELAGEYFLVMEWLRGGNLSRVAGVERAPLPWTAVALVGSQLCDALAYVHARTNRGGAGLVHGDLTPRNVLLSADGHALLADFGLARFAGHGRAGTVRYLSPEQARGDDFDGRADLYALALVLCEAATGRPAYDLDGERAARQARVGVMPELDGCDAGLAAVLRRALGPTPEARFADAAAMRAAFDALLDREPGARSAGRAALIARIEAAAPEAGGDAAGTRTAATQATREATRLPLPRRFVGLAAALLVVAGGAAWIARASLRPPVAMVPRSLPTTKSPLPPRSAAPATPATATPPAPAATAATASAATAATRRTTATTPAATAPTPPTAATAPSPAAPAPPVHERRAHARHEAPSAAPASLDVNATPWAHVRIDGTPRGETPLLGLTLPPGPHRIELTNEPLGVHRELTVTLSPGEHAKRIEDLTR